MRVTLLGTGTSHGVPTIDCIIEDYARCPRQVCLKAQRDPTYRRTRASILVETASSHILIDTSQDFREQMLANGVRRIDAVLYTHGHADHIYGLPDIRSYTRHREEPLPLYGSEETLGILRQAFHYAFEPPAYVGGGIPHVAPRLLEGPTEIGGLLATPIAVEHGPLNGCQGYRLGDLAYLPDVKRIPPASLDKLQGLELLILNCLRLRPHGSHLSLDESLHYVDILQPRRCLLTHMTHDIDAQEDQQRLPEHVRFAHDGLIVQVR